MEPFCTHKHSTPLQPDQDGLPAGIFLGRAPERRRVRAPWRKLSPWGQPGAPPMSS